VEALGNQTTPLVQTEEEKREKKVRQRSQICGPSRNKKKEDSWPLKKKMGDCPNNRIVEKAEGYLKAGRLHLFGKGEKWSTHRTGGEKLCDKGALDERIGNGGG